MKTTVPEQVARWKAQRPDTITDDEVAASGAQWLDSSTAPEMSAVVWKALDGYVWELKKSGMAARAHASADAREINTMITAN